MTIKGIRLKNGWQGLNFNHKKLDKSFKRLVINFH